MDQQSRKLFRQRPRFTDFNSDDIEEIPCKFYFHSVTEKKDLVELVIRQNASNSSGSGSSSGPSSGQGQPEQPAPSSSSRRAPEERQKSFPKAYVESTHRHEWLEKMNENANNADRVQLSCEEDDDDFIVVTPVTPMDNTSTYSEKQWEKMVVYFEQDFLEFFFDFPRFGVTFFLANYDINDGDLHCFLAHIELKHLINF